MCFTLQRASDGYASEPTIDDDVVLSKCALLTVSFIQRNNCNAVINALMQMNEWYSLNTFCKWALTSLTILT